mgnify:CR=1 FL=1
MILKKSKSFTYEEIDKLSNKLLNALLKHVDTNSKIMFLLENTTEFILIYLACQKLGITACPVSPLIGNYELSGIIDKIKPSVIFFEDELFNKVKSAANTKYQKVKYISIDDTIKADNGKDIINFYSFIKHELDTFDYSSKMNTYDYIINSFHNKIM